MNCALLKQQLIEAEAALHRLMIGAHEVSVRDGDKQVTYSQVSIAQLRTYIEKLRGQIQDCEGVPRTGRSIFYITPH